MALRRSNAHDRSETIEIDAPFSPSNAPAEGRANRPVRSRCRASAAQDHGNADMMKLAVKAAVALVLTAAPAAAVTQTWNVSEQSTSGIALGQGTWAVTIDGDKVSGKAEMQYDDGKPYTYSFEGAKSESGYDVTLSGRSDKKDGCVWSGRLPKGADPQALKLAGKVQCATGGAFTIKSSQM
jgi:hypothetical protein